MTPPSSLLNRALTLINSLSLLGFLIAILRLRPELIRIYEDLDAALPLVTRLLIGVHPVVWILATLFLALLLIAKDLLLRPGLRLGINLLFLVSGLLVAIFHALSLMMPLLVTVSGS